MNDIDLYICTHKPVDYAIPPYCKFIQVNCAATQEHWDEYLHDDAGENISRKNYCYCELTALYSLWKNSQASVKGLFHYRRFFSNKDVFRIGRVDQFVREKNIKKKFITEENIRQWLSEHNIIVEYPQSLSPFTVKDNLLLYVYENDIDKLVSVIEQHFPEYAESLNKTLNATSLSYCNMLIAGGGIFDNYCAWVFDVLEKMEDVCYIETYDQQHQRIYGFLAEVLMNVYIAHHGLSAKYVENLYVYDFFPNMVEKGYKVFITSTLRKILLAVGFDWELYLRKQDYKNIFKNT